MAGVWQDIRGTQQQNEFDARMQPMREDIMRQQLEQQAAAEGRARQDQRMQMIEIARERLAQDQARRAAKEGASAYTGYLRNPEMVPGGSIPGASAGVQSATEALAAAGAGPNVGLIPQLRKPEMAPLSIDRLAQSIAKQNPNITPEGMVQALERFAPQLERDDKLKLAKLKSRTAGFDLQGSMFEEAYQDALSSGASEIEARAAGNKAAVAAKRRTASEEGLVAEQKATGKVRGEKGTELSQRESRIPQLLNTVNKLSDLGKTATYTTSGKILDVGRKELGMSARPQAVARTEYIATVDNEILPLLRETFGAQFTQKEGESLKVTLGDPDLQPEQKDAVLRAFIRTKMETINTARRELGASDRFSPEEIEAVAVSVGASPEASPAATPRTINFADLPD